MNVGYFLRLCVDSYIY